MSYDFHLFLPKPGVDPRVVAQAGAAEAEDVEEINPGPPDPVKETRKRTVAAALVKHDPALKVFHFGFEEIAKAEAISVEEAKLRYRHLELNGPESGPGIQITLFDDAASLTVPFWHTGEKAKAVFAQIWEYLRVIQSVAGYQIYDPQLERFINLQTDLGRTTKYYAGLVNGVVGVKRLWWKFW
jgi:hypothetical protein